MKNVAVSLLVALALVFIVSCGASNDISGEYVCIKHFSEDGVGELSLDFAKDGDIHTSSDGTVAYEKK